MGLYRDEPEVLTPQQVSNILFSREDIQRYQEDMLRHVAQFEQNRQECENAMNDLREARFEYERKIRAQGEKIDELTFLVVKLSNKLEKLDGQ